MKACWSLFGLLLAELCPVLIEVIVENKKKWRIGWGVNGDGGPIKSELQHHVLLFALLDGDTGATSHWLTKQTNEYN